MARLMLVPAALGALALGACAAAPPPGPSVMAWPGNGKNFAAFQSDDAACQQFASQSVGGATPAGAANESALTTAVTGTLVGAAAGAGIGAAAGNPALGAAIGAGAGLLVGSAAGVNASQYSSAELQQRYDMRYEQCMYSKGNQVPGVQSAYAAPSYGPTVTPVFTQVTPSSAPSRSVMPAAPVAPVTPAK